MSKPLRIFQVFAQMNRGGAETMIMNIYRKIDRSKIQFDFIVHTDEKCAYDDEIVSLGGRIIRVPAYKGKNHFIYMKHWNEIFNEYPENKLIHGHVRSTASLYLKVAKKNGLITIAHSHSTSSGSGLQSIVKNILQIPIRYRADYLFACSMAAGKWLYGKRVDISENYYILNNAIDTERFLYNEKVRKEKRKELKIEDKFVIGHIGSFHSPKNHEFLIDIFKSISEENQDSILMLVGDGGLKKSIERKVNDLNLTDKVIFTGVRADIPDLLQTIDVFLFPSLYEGLPVTLVEAQASSLPCVISDTITDEVEIFKELLEFVSLKKSSQEWARKVLSHENYSRKNTYTEIVNAGYDINTTTRWIQSFYLNSFLK